MAAPAYYATAPSLRYTGLELSVSQQAVACI